MALGSGHEPANTRRFAVTVERGDLRDHLFGGRERNHQPRRADQLDQLPRLEIVFAAQISLKVGEARGEGLSTGAGGPSLIRKARRTCAWS
ncbi:MAG: hypothetical protein V4459_07375 [Pseudomonadota bacterium]